MASEEFRSSPEVRTGFVKGNTFGYRPVQYYVIDGQAIFEGDIVLDSVDGMERLVADVIAETGVAAGVVITGKQFRWPGGIVPFTIDPALPDVARVNDAILHWHNRTSIRLVRSHQRAELCDLQTWGWMFVTSWDARGTAVHYAGPRVRQGQHNPRDRTCRRYLA